jgi:hypothetical protein
VSRPPCLGFSSAFEFRGGTGCRGEAWPAVELGLGACRVELGASLKLSSRSQRPDEPSYDPFLDAMPLTIWWRLRAADVLVEDEGSSVWPRQAIPTLRRDARDADRLARGEMSDFLGSTGWAFANKQRCGCPPFHRPALLVLAVAGPNRQRSQNCDRDGYEKRKRASTGSR